MLAAWMRARYPWLVAGALASSAPLQGWAARRPSASPGYWAVVAQAVAHASPTCTGPLQQALGVVWSKASDAEGREWLQQNLGLCRLPDSRSSVAGLLGELQGAFSTLAQLNYPYPVAFLGHDLPAHPLSIACAALSLPATDEQLMAQLRQAAAVALPSSAPPNCLNASSSFAQSTPGLIDGAWTFQRCTEIVLPFFVDSPSPFPDCDSFLPNCWNNLSLEVLHYTHRLLYRNYV